MKAKKIISGIFAVITALVFIFGFYIFITVMNSKEGEVPTVFGFSIMKIQTGSMEPEYKTGSVIITRDVSPEKLLKGDVISYYVYDEVIGDVVNTHRIEEIQYIKKNLRQFVTKGDANEFPDEFPVLESRVIGKVVLNLGVMSGSVIGFLQNPNIILFLIVIPLIIITFIEAVNLVKLIVNRNETEEDETDESHGKSKSKNKNPR